jgi:xanthine permease
MPETVKILSNSGIVAGSLTAILLNLIFNVLKSTKKNQSLSQENNQTVA